MSNIQSFEPNDNCYSVKLVIHRLIIKRLNKKLLTVNIIQGYEHLFQLRAEVFNRWCINKCYCLSSRHHN